nr:hypothetical protein [Marinicella sp. W31]MDC2876139.1 hypothetical protein [Marinicella sp. W31]
MTITPQYAVPSGTQITVRQRTLQVNRRHASGYEALDVESGEGRFIPFAAFAAALKAPGTRLMRGLSASTSASRLGEYETVEALSPQQRKAAEFHHALCKGMEELRARLVKKQRRPGLNLSIRMLNAPANREKIVAVAQGYFDERIRLQPRLGGKSADWTLYQGRTLRKYWQLYQDLPPDVDPLEALVCRDDRKGNRQARLGQEVCELMTQAWEAVGLDLKNPSIASVSNHLEMLIAEKNRFRQMNELPGLVMPSAATLKAHRDLLVDPTAYEVATMGERHARNTRGRGSTDIRALLPGEYVEIDEYKFSLVTVAKVHGLWANLSSDHRSL